VKTLNLDPIFVPKSSDVLAAELRRRILSGALPNGAPLPPERELVAQTGLSRGSVREALRVLEAQRLVTTRPGRFGGSVANKPDDQSFRDGMSLFVAGRGISLLELQQTREAVAPQLAALAARHRSDAQLAQIREVTQRVEDAFDDVPLFLRENVNWHFAIAEASGNQLLRAFMFSLGDLVYKATALDNFATDEIRRKVVQAHRHIVQAIAARDAKGAFARMARHLSAVTAAFEAFPHAPLVLDV
jgi:GntR family transcriptional regulator, transcriptional repressor for pyruvate dehydrogenase complex